ncbi:MAG: peptidase, partial [Candidatus Cloacimonadota bacterium]
VIPVQNVKDLMLKEEIVNAVADKKFHVYSISGLEEGIEILTGVKAGKKTKEGYEKDTVFDLVERKLKDMYAKSRAIKEEDEKPKKTKK